MTQWQVGASSDDCYVYETGTSHPPWSNWLPLTTTVIDLGKGSTYYTGGGCRFTNITIPQGATILTAYLIFTSYTNLSGTTCNVKLSCEDADNAATFSDLTDYNARARTAYVNWNDLPAWTLDTEYTSPDITSIVQTVINRVGWVSGNALVVFAEDNGTVGDATRSAYSYDGSTTKAPKLVITWSGPTEESKLYAVDVYLGTDIRKEVATNGRSQPLGFIMYPSGECYNNRTYVAYTGSNTVGADCDIMVTYFDHLTKAWQTPVKAADATANDPHVCPAIMIDGYGYIHLFSAADLDAAGHNLKHWKSDSPEDISAFTVQADVRVRVDPMSIAYPHIVQSGNNCWIFYGISAYTGTPTSRRDFRYKKGSIASDGTITWENEVVGINDGYSAPYYYGVYLSTTELSGTKIHMVWFHVTSEPRRRDVFHAYFDITDSKFHNMANTMGGGSGVTTIELQDMWDYCRVVNSGTDWSSDPSAHCDSSAYPWILYHTGSETSQTMYMIGWNGSNWGSPSTITTTDSWANAGDFIIYSTTNIEAFVTTAGLSGIGGDIEAWKYNGSSWSRKAYIYTESAAGKPLMYPMVPLNYNNEVRCVFSIYPAAGDFTTNVKVWSWGLITVSHRIYKADVLLKKLGVSKAYPIDTLLKKLDVPVAYAVDALLKKLGISKSYGIDTYFGPPSVSYTRAYFLDVLFKKLGLTRTYASDVLLKKLDLTKTFAVDTAFQKSTSKTYGADAAFKKAISPNYYSDVLLKKLDVVKTYGVDAILGVTFTVVTRNYYVDVVLKKLGITQNYAVDTLLAKLALTKTYSMDVTFVLRLTKTYSADVAFQKYNLPKSYGVDVYFGVYLLVPVEPFKIDLECDTGETELNCDTGEVELYGG